MKATHPEKNEFNIEKARSEAEAANERRKTESMIEKQAIRLALMSRHNQQAENTL
jgi:hypothetical protein